MAITFVGSEQFQPVVWKKDFGCTQWNILASCSATATALRVTPPGEFRRIPPRGSPIQAAARSFA
jgi:hypothetical protein